ncbi:glycerate kinase [bacterium I07]|nr:glycerate kinase [bacterium I07]
MKIVLAPDSFKESLSAADVCKAMQIGIERVSKDLQIESIPMADGGEGTVQALVASTDGEFIDEEVVGPLGGIIKAQYGILGDGETAVIEMAEASGLQLVPLSARNPLKTTTYGTGQLMLSALEKGCRKIIMGIGGSATTDCGAGMAQALGTMFYNDEGSEIKTHMTGELMRQVASIDLKGRDGRLKQAEITVACDVDNPLLGPRGAVMIYSPQKGATPDQLEILENYMIHFIEIAEKTISREIRGIPGTGAAGGLGAGLIAFADARLRPGVKLVMEACNFSDRIRNASLILSGEGRVDVQTAYGKTISGVTRAAKKQDIPVVVLGGSIGEGVENLYELGVNSLFSICSGPMSLEEAKQQAFELIADSSERIFRLFTIM